MVCNPCYRADPESAMTCRRRRCATRSGHLRPGDGLGAPQDQKPAGFSRAATLSRSISLENRSSPNPSRARARCHGRARHILAHTLPQTISRCDLSLSSSRRHIDPAAIAWSQPWRPCATPNMPVPSPCSSLDRAIFGIVIFAASWTLGVRFQWPGVPKTPFARWVFTRTNYLTAPRVSRYERRDASMAGKVFADSGSAL